MFCLAMLRAGARAQGHVAGGSLTLLVTRAWQPAIQQCPRRQVPLRTPVAAASTPIQSPQPFLNPPGLPCCPAAAVFTSSVGNEATVAVIALSIFPFLNEVKNKLEGEPARPGREKGGNGCRSLEGAGGQAGCDWGGQGGGAWALGISQKGRQFLRGSRCVQGWGPVCNQRASSARQVWGRPPQRRCCR